MITSSNPLGRRCAQTLPGRVLPEPDHDPPDPAICGRGHRACPRASSRVSAQRIWLRSPSGRTVSYLSADFGSDRRYYLAWLQVRRRPSGLFGMVAG